VELRQFHNRHKGETALLVGNGPNLQKTPPEWFDYPSFGLNTIFYYEGWKPIYYVAVDACIQEDYGELVNAAFHDIPKFVPADLSTWTGDNFYHFEHRKGITVMGGKPVTAPDALEVGIGFTNSMTAAMQIALHMGFTTLLMIGVEQKPGYGELVHHFWGADSQTPPSQTDEHWNIGYVDVRNSAPHTRILNISEGTYVPESVLPRDDWRNWKNN
jgi:hypothetical protein